MDSPASDRFVRVVLVSVTPPSPESESESSDLLLRVRDDVVAGRGARIVMGMLTTDCLRFTAIFETKPSFCQPTMTSICVLFK